MPGIFGIVSRTPSDTEHADRMAAAQRRFPWQTSQTVSGETGGARIGAVLLDTADARTGAWKHSSVLTAVEGELYEPAEPHARLVRRGMTFDGDHFGELLARGLWSEGASFLDAVHGYFGAALWDGEREQLTLVTDRFGMRPLYWTKWGGGLAFASEIKALLALPGVSRRLSDRGLSQFFAFGQFFGDATLYDGITTVPAGSTLVYDAGDDRTRIESYVTRPVVELDGRDARELADEVGRRIAVAVERRTLGTRNLGLSLSGGLDGRTILAMVPGGVPLTTVSLGVPGSIDHDSAARLAGLAGRQHHELILGDGFLARFEEYLRQMVDLTDGHYLDQGIVMTTLPEYRALGVRTLLRGHAGELMHMTKAYAFSLDRAALALADRKGVGEWLSTHLTNYMIGAVEGPLFARGRGIDVRERARATVVDALSEIPDTDPPVQQIWHVFVRERLRRETAASLHLFRSFVEVRVPFMDDDLVPLLLALPPALKLDDALQTHILRTLRPDFLKVINTNTGARMGAGRLTARTAFLKMKVLAKLGVPGYQPYERLGLWLATHLRPMVHRLLLSDRVLDGGVFDADTVRRLVAEHESRQKNHTFLLMAMIIFAIGQENSRAQ
jgi:asparagine synthase (glutamine-hydrolysing)